MAAVLQQYTGQLALVDSENKGSAINARWSVEIGKIDFAKGDLRLAFVTGVQDEDGFIRRLSYQVAARMSGAFSAQ
jgi:hypothetical protein